MLVKVPDAPEPGATLPQSDALQETLHVTPLLESSPVMVAVTGSVPVASIDGTLADTATLICGRTIIGEPPPQLSNVSVERTATKANAQRKLRSMAPLSARQESRNDRQTFYSLPLKRNSRDDWLTTRQKLFGHATSEGK